MNNSASKYLLGSPNSSRINNPLAESTAIGSPLSHQQESYRGHQKRKTLSPLMNASKQRQMMTQIEPHILTNAQSRGIVKRLVTYYDESQSDGDKSKYIYNRVGDFPIVQLKKTELKRNLVRSPSVRIAPPTKTVMNRDVRAAILRSNSLQFGSGVPKLLPTKMRAKDDSHQIITNHEPLSSNESPQTAKSVLDALEKNCRKRINNEELTLDRNKRMCAPNAPIEVVDGPSPREFAPIAPQSVKRGRDQVSPAKGNLRDSPNSQLRKKSKIRNNALFSSLSSSHYTLKPYVASPMVPYSIPKVLASSTVTSSNANFAESVEQSEKQLKEVSITAEKKGAETQRTEPATKRLMLFNKKVDSSIVRTRLRIDDDDDDEDEVKINFVKPRERPANQEADVVRDMEKEKLSKMLTGLGGGFKSPTKDDANDSVDAPPSSDSFTTSTTTSSVSQITTPASTANTLTSIATPTIPSITLSTTGKPIETSQKTEASSVTFSTLATSKSSDGEPIKSLPSFQFGAQKTESSALPVIGAGLVSIASTTTSAAATGRLSPLATFSSPPNKSVANVTFDANKSMISFTPSAKTSETPSLAASLTSSNPIPAAIVAPLSTNAGGFGITGTKEAPKLSTGGFSFGGNSTSSTFSSAGAPVMSLNQAVIPTTAQPAATLAPSFSFQAPASTAFSFGAKPVIPTSTTTASMPTISGISGITTLNGNPGNTTTTLSFPHKTETTTASGVGFSFNPTTQTQPSAAAITTTSNSGFSFGTTQSSSGPTAAVIPAAGANSTFSFGSTNSNTFGQPSATSTGFGQTTAPISFGGAAPSGFGNSTASTAVFGGASNAPTATPSLFGNSAASTVGFSNISQKTEPQPPATGMFSFGQKTSAPAPAAANSTFSFGGAAQPAAPQSSAFSFGQNNSAQSPPGTVTAQSAGIFARLGDKQADAKPAFSFGGSTQPQQPQQQMFGGSNTSSPAQPTAPIFGSSGSSGFNQPPVGGNMFGNNQQINSPSNSFDSAPKPTNGSMFSFGNNNQQPQQQQQQHQQHSQSIQPSQSGMFSFGSNSAPSNNITSPSFGGNSTQNVSASFSFKPSTGVVTNTSASNAFGNNQNSSSAGPPPAYQFGGQPANTASASFTFGGNSSNSAPTAPSSGFNFGAPQTAPVNSSGAFNFQGQQPVLTPQPSPGGLFNIGTGGNPQRRPIRQATRRMK